MTRLQAELETLLEDFSIPVQRDSRAQAYYDGVVWVLPESYELVGAGFAFNVVCAVSPGADIGSLAETVWNNLHGVATDEYPAKQNYEPTFLEIIYGQPPIAGRDMKPADVANINVQSNIHLPIDEAADA